MSKFNGVPEAMQCRCAILGFLFPFLMVGGPSDGGLFGTILDPSGAVVPNALVIAFNDDAGIRRSAFSNQEGFYAIGNLVPGHYRILVRKDGFISAVRAGLSLGVQHNVRYDFVLRVGPVEQVVTVEGGPSLLNSDPGPPATILGRKLVGELPLRGRSLAGILELVPGVLGTPANTGEAGQFSTSGQRPNENYISVDGVSVNGGISGAGIPGQFSGGTLPMMTAMGSLHNLASLDAIDEITIQTSSFAPEFGRMPGAHVAINTRAGSNSFHGSVSDSINTAALNANDWLANSSSLPRPATHTNDFAAVFGGPIQRNRLFFFLAYEQIELRHPLVWQTPVPSDAIRQNASQVVAPLLAAFPLPNGPLLADGLASLRVSAARPAEARIGSLRLDRSLTSRLNIFARYSNSPSWSEFGYSVSAT